MREIVTALALCAVVLIAMVATAVSAAPATQVRRVSAADTGKAGEGYPKTRQDVARKGGLPVSRQKQHTVPPPPPKPVLLYFYAAWAVPCKHQDPIYEKLKKEFGAKVEFKKIDVDKDPQLAKKYAVYSVPKFVLECNGKAIERWLGITTQQMFKSKLNKAIESCKAGHA